MKSNLTHNEDIVLSLRNNEKLSFSLIADQLNLSVSRIQQIYKKANRKIDSQIKRQNSQCVCGHSGSLHPISKGCSECDCPHFFMVF
jgi:hypothetical protein